MRIPHFFRARRRALVAGTVAALVAALVGVPLAAGADTLPPPPPFADGHGLHVLGVQQFDARDYNVQVLSADLGRPINIRLLLPTDYADNPDERYPTLYLFHGTSGFASDWVQAGDAEQTTANLPLITVMPEVGFNGDGGFWFTNWVDQTTTHGPSQFEDYLINQLIPWVDQNLRTEADRDGRAVAGLSQGGYGSAEMAARHPDMFTSMATFSGAPEIERDPDVFAGAIGVIEAIEVGDDRVPPFSELGNPALDQINWEGHDPATLIENLRGMSIDMWTGMGVDGPYDSQPNPAGTGIEAAVYESTQHFYQHLVEAGIPAYYDNYVYGTHSFPYWARDLRDYVPRMMADFANPQTPTAAYYTSIDPQWSQWGYSVSLQRSAAQEFSTLSHGTPDGFWLSGSGTATVTTPPSYPPDTSMTVTVAGTPDAGTRTLQTTSDGRLQLQLELGTNGQAKVTVAPASA